MPEPAPAGPRPPGRGARSGRRQARRRPGPRPSRPRAPRLARGPRGGLAPGRPVSAPARAHRGRAARPPPGEGRGAGRGQTRPRGHPPAPGRDRRARRVERQRRGGTSATRRGPDRRAPSARGPGRPAGHPRHVAPGRRGRLPAGRPAGARGRPRGRLGGGRGALSRHALGRRGAAGARQQLPEGRPRRAGRAPLPAPAGGLPPGALGRPLGLARGLRGLPRRPLRRGRHRLRAVSACQARDELHPRLPLLGRPGAPAVGPGRAGPAAAAGDRAALQAQLPRGPCGRGAARPGCCTGRRHVAGAAGPAHARGRHPRAPAHAAAPAAAHRARRRGPRGAAGLALVAGRAGHGVLARVAPRAPAPRHHGHEARLPRLGGGCRGPAPGRGLAHPLPPRVPRRAGARRRRRGAGPRSGGGAGLPGVHLRARSGQLGRRAGPDADHAGHGPHPGPPDRPALQPHRAATAGHQPADGHALPARHARPLRRLGREGPGRVQCRPAPGGRLDGAAPEPLDGGVRREAFRSRRPGTTS